MQRAERKSIVVIVGGGNSNEALARPLAAKIGLNNLSMKKSSMLVTRYLDYLLESGDSCATFSGVGECVRQF